MNKVSNKTFKIAAVAVMVLLVFAALFYFLNTKGGNLITGNPGDVVEEFIEKWHVNGTLANKPLADKISATSGILTRDFALSLGGDEGSIETGSIDPETCLLKIEGKVKLERQEVNREEGQATMHVVQETNAGDSRQAVFSLIASGGAWRINEINCIPQ